MKNVIVFLVLVLSLFCAPYTTSSENKESDWFPFVLAEKLDPASLVNIGKLVLDAPAGKHGFVTARDGHFYFEDGTRARFWGTNLCFDACFPSKEQAEMMAERIAFFGFNAVRLHHMDFHFEPRWIFKDICPTYQDPQLKKTGILSGRQLDRLDCLIYQLKQRGIYIDQSQSLNIYLPEPNMRQVKAIHDYSERLRLKTGMYYLRANPSSQTDRFTVDIDVVKFYNTYFGEDVNLPEVKKPKVEKKNEIICTDEVCIMCQ